MYTLIVFVPFCSAIVTSFSSRFIGRKGSAIFSTGMIFLSFCITCYFIPSFICSDHAVHFKWFSWIDISQLRLSWGFLFDSLTITILFVVTSISTLVHLYSSAYIEEDPHLPRFISYLSLFTFFILVLVTADNFVQIFVGWEGVGLCSYLLINFWFTRIQANKAAIKAIVVNRVGDVGLVLGILGVFLEYGSVDYGSVFASVPFNQSNSFFFIFDDFNSITVITILFFVGAVGKSAQLGLHTWLPDAIEGPTPVSALIHAATIVTAGVFLICRCSLLFEFSAFALKVVTCFGAATAFFASTTGLLQNDLKKVIAYSTCSQLGYIVFACGVSAYSVGFFHLVNHAFFKALLFLGAGSVIHAIADEQDMRKIGGAIRFLPLSYSVILVGSIALMGFPFLTGFYSKDVILESAYAHFSVYGHFSFWIGTGAAFFTAFYSTRLLFLTFIVKPNGFRKVYENAHEPSANMVIPLVILCFGSIFWGYLSRDLFIGLGGSFISHSLFVHPYNLFVFKGEFLPSFIKLTPVFFSISGFLLALYMYGFDYISLFNIKKSSIGQKLYIFLNRKWFFDKFYNEIISQKLSSVSYGITYKHIDRGFFEAVGPHGLSLFIYGKAYSMSSINSGMVYHYMLTMLLFMLFLAGIGFAFSKNFACVSLIFIFLICSFF